MSDVEKKLREAHFQREFILKKLSELQELIMQNSTALRKLKEIKGLL